MILKYKLPDDFVPENNEFCLYSAIKLLKGNYISKDEAVKMAGCNGKLFDNAYANSSFEKRYKKICGEGYADGDFEREDE